ncbi:ATP-binding cassette domain-containing protein [Rhodobacterales bacterium HKCCE4037]|nr:ATP-binding cassette domain-containing protein [Rhodobacterales bacterium HKCCE4037]
MPAPRLELTDVSARFDGRDVLHRVNLSVGAGEVLCLLGPSGCGKSTTLRVVAGIERQSEGVVRAEGEVLSDADVHLPPEARGVGLIFQDFALFPHLSVAKNVGFGLRGSGVDVKARVGELLERVDLAGYGDKAPHMLSGGEQQRVALARAMAPRPRIMLMDEPFSGLDNRLRDGIRDETLALLKEEGTAVVLVTHEPEEAMRMADQIALMRDGGIVQIGAPYNIYANPCDRDAAAFFSDINVIRGKVQGALIDTAFGQFLAPGVPDGGEVEIVFRPQHVGIDFDRGGKGPNPTPQQGAAARGLVERARFMGHESLVEFRMDFDGSLLKATVPNVFLPAPGTPLWLTVRRDRCFVFPIRR